MINDGIFILSLHEDWIRCCIYQDLAVCLILALGHCEPPCSPWGIQTWNLSTFQGNRSWWSVPPVFGDLWGKHLRTVTGKVFFISFWGPPRDCSLKLPNEHSHGERQILSKHTKSRLWSENREYLRDAIDWDGGIFFIWSEICSNIIETHSWQWRKSSLAWCLFGTFFYLRKDFEYPELPNYTVRVTNFKLQYPAGIALPEVQE